MSVYPRTEFAEALPPFCFSRAFCTAGGVRVPGNPAAIGGNSKAFVAAVAVCCTALLASSAIFVPS